jgi:hypothetical protein
MVSGVPIDEHTWNNTWKSPSQIAGILNQYIIIPNIGISEGYNDHLVCQQSDAVGYTKLSDAFIIDNTIDGEKIANVTIENEKIVSMTYSKLTNLPANFIYNG